LQKEFEKMPLDLNKITRDTVIYTWRNPHVDSQLATEPAPDKISYVDFRSPTLAVHFTSGYEATIDNVFASKEEALADRAAKTQTHALKIMEHAAKLQVAAAVAAQPIKAAA
jgi:hypothetical protein